MNSLSDEGLATVIRRFRFSARFLRCVQCKGKNGSPDCSLAWSIGWSLAGALSLISTGCGPDGLEIVGPTVVMDPIEECTGTQVQLSSLEDETPFGASTAELLALLPAKQQSPFKWSSPEGPIIFHDFGDAAVDLSFEIIIDPEEANPAYLEGNSCPPQCKLRGLLRIAD